jgi:hypothetical protein
MAIDKLIGDLEEGIPAPTDFVMYDPGGTGFYKKSQVGNLPGGGGGLTTLATPTLTATVISATQINLSWTNVANESSYKLEWSANGTTGWTQIGGTIAANTITFSHTGLTASTAYYYRVSAIGDGVTYATSGFGTANGTTSAAGDVTAPTVVSATVPNGAANTVVVVFSESVTVTTAGWSFRRNTSNWAVSSVAGSGTTWTFTMATSAANGETIDRSYDSATGATVDAAANELVSFTNAAVTNSIAGSATFLTFPTLPTGFEAYNSAKGIRTTSGYTEAWTGILANETLAVGQRMVVKTDGIDKFSSFSVSDNTTTGSSWSAQVGGRQTDTNDGVIEGVNMNAAYNEAINNNYFYGILYEAAAVGGVGDNGILRLQKSADGTSWTTMASLTTASFTGAIYMKIFIYSASHGFSEIYKI